MKIHSYEQEGAWVSAYLSYYKFAWLSYEDFCRCNEEIKLLEIKIRKELINDEKSIVESYIHHKTQNLVSESYRFAESTVIFSALAIEGFLNDYGFKRIGEKLYIELLERKSPIKKFQLIWQICFDEEVENDGRSYQAVRELFRERNDLVHPKTTKFDFENPSIEQHPEDLNVKRHLDNMETIINKFIEKDNTIPSTFFRKEHEEI